MPMKRENIELKPKPKPKPPVDNGFVKGGKVRSSARSPRDKQGFPLASSNEMSPGKTYQAMDFVNPKRIPSLNDRRRDSFLHYGNPAGWAQEVWSAVSGGDVKNKVNTNYSLEQRKKLGKIMALQQSREAITNPAHAKAKPKPKPKPKPVVPSNVGSKTGSAPSKSKTEIKVKKSHPDFGVTGSATNRKGKHPV